MHSLHPEKSAKFWCHPTHWAKNGSILRFFRENTLSLLPHASFWRIFSWNHWFYFITHHFDELFGWFSKLRFSMLFFDAILWYVKTVFANIFHKVCYKIIVIPNGPSALGLRDGIFNATLGPIELNNSPLRYYYLELVTFKNEL